MLSFEGWLANKTLYTAEDIFADIFDRQRLRAPAIYLRFDVYWWPRHDSLISYEVVLCGIDRMASWGL